MEIDPPASNARNLNMVKNSNLPLEPPPFAHRFLKWFCPPGLLEGIEGDLLEKWEKDIHFIRPGENDRKRIKRANRNFIVGVLRFFRPSLLLRNSFTITLLNTIMFRNYVLISFRNILKAKVFSAINIIGLGIGLAACLLIFQFVSYELSYDTFHEKLDRTYRITNDRFQNGQLIQHGTIMYPTIGPVMARDYPEIEEYTRLMPGGTLNIKAGNEIFRGGYCHFADEHFFSVFSFPFLAGQRATALKERYTMVLPEHTAIKYFGNKGGDYSALIGKTLYWGLDTQPYTVTGICKDIPENSHIQFDALVSYATLIHPDNHNADDSWTWSDMRHYLVLKPGASAGELESKFPAFSDHYFKGDKVSGSVEKFYLQPLRKAHLYSDYEYDIAKTANGKAVWAMLVVALFILILAWINYINLTTSRALERAKEVGLRKVMGAMRGQLIKQFIFESVLVSFMAFIVALVLVQLGQGAFNKIVSGNLSLWKVIAEANTESLGIVILIMAAGVLLSGFYPAFILSSYQPARVLKGSFQRSSGGSILRKGLVVFQFMASAALITGTFIVSKQLRYMDQADLGINIRDTMVIQAPERTPWDSTFIQRVETYKHALEQIPGVASASTSGHVPGDRLGRAFGIHLADQSSETHYTMSVFNADHDFFDTYQVKLIAGRKFLPSDHNVKFEDIHTVVLNQNAIELLGIRNPQNAIGREIIWNSGSEKKWTIIGVVANFHQEGLKNPMEPLVFRPVYSTYFPATLRIVNGDRQGIISKAEAVFKQFFPDNSYEYFFMEDYFKRQYNDDNRFGAVINIFTVLAIIISCLGLVGLSSYTAVQRTKEIGIRKTLGASLFNVVSLLSGDFIKLVFVAVILSLPIAYFGMQEWLQRYTYKTVIDWWLYVVPILVILLIAAATISFQVIKTAMINPAETLKHE
jgi:putative ABC transport system permease protein